MTIVPANAMVVDPQELRNIPLKLGENVYIRDVGTVADATDIPVGYALVNGRKSVYLPVVKQASASTLTVVNAVKQNLSRFQAAVPDDVKVSYEFDESPIVYRAIESVGVEGALGAGLTGLMVLLFLRDLRAVIVVVLNIPLALLGSIVVLCLTGNTINIMTLGGLALAIGILVDEATVEIENIHTQMEHTPSMSRAVRQGNMETAVPRLLALLCILSVFIPSFIMQGAGAVAVRAAVAGRRLRDDHVVPALQHVRAGPERLAAREPPRDARPGRTAQAARPGFFVRMQDRFERVVVVDGRAPPRGGAGVPGRDRRRRGRRGRAARPRALPEGRRRPVPAPRPAAAGDPLRADPPGGAEDARGDRRGGGAGERRHHDGLRRRRTRRSSPSTWPTSGAGGPTTACSASASARGAGSTSSSCRSGCARSCRRRWARGSASELLRLGLTAEQADQRVADLVFAFEPGDLISETMSLGAPAPIEVVVSGRNLADSSAFMDKLREQFDGIAVAPRRPGPAVAPLPDRPGHPRPRAGRPQRRDRPRHRRVADRGHLLQPLHLAQLLARRRQRQLVPGPGAGPAAEDDRGDRRRARAADDPGQPPAGGEGRPTRPPTPRRRS